MLEALEYYMSSGSRHGIERNLDQTPKESVTTGKGRFDSGLKYVEKRSKKGSLQENYSQCENPIMRRINFGPQNWLKLDK